MREVFEAGELDWTKTRQVARIATDETAAEWIEAARTLTSRELERKVAEARGEEVLVRMMVAMRPGDAADVDLALKRLREELCGDVDLGEAIAELARRAMGAPVERPGYQVVVHQCPTCETASRDAFSGQVELTPAALPARSRTIRVDLDAEPVGIAQVQRFADEVVRCGEIIARPACKTLLWF